mmetsp:Transcript_15887/g.30732  ORF Transcript_15887/g.30732 Transcript_15887/m.30732 type:complete len:308 (+) Transcript_15887:1957-2880(+)
MSRVTEREDNRAGTTCGHSADSIFCKESWHTGDSDHDRGFNVLDHVHKAVLAILATTPVAALCEWGCEIALEGKKVFLSVMHKTIAIDHVNSASSLFFSETFADHTLLNHFSDTTTSASCTNHNDIAVLERDVGLFASSQECRKNNGSGSLDIIIESTKLVAVFFQDRRCRLDIEILPLEKSVGKELLNAIHKLVDKLKILLATKTLVTPADVTGLVEDSLVVGSDVKEYWKGLGSGDASNCRVQRALTDRNTLAVSSEVAKTEDAASVGYHNCADIETRIDIYGSTSVTTSNKVLKHIAHLCPERV